MAAAYRTAVFLVKGLREFGRTGYDKAEKTFDDIALNKGLDGRVCMVTGANQGLGLQTAQDLAKRGAIVHMVCRNPERGRKAVDDVIAATGNTAVHLQVYDVSSLTSLRKLAATFTASEQPLHVLVNNAGAIFNEPSKSADGFEASFATNTLGFFALTSLLEPVLKRSAPSCVTNVSSGGMYLEGLDVDDLQSEKVNKHDGAQLYAKDKRRMVALTERQAERWKGSGVAAYSMHPGWTVTDGVKNSIPDFYKTFGSRMRTLPQGADTVVWLAAEDPEKLQEGAFYLDRKPASKHLPLAGTTYTSADVDRLWSQLTAILDASAGQ